MIDPKNKNQTIRLFVILGIITFIVGFFVFFDGRINKEVKSHPAVIQLQEQYKNVEKSLERIEKKVDKLLEQR